MIRLTVIVPAYQDAAGLRTTAESLLAQDYPAERAEILLVDNGSTDDTHLVAEEIAAGAPGRVRALLEREKRGSYAARNLGIASARGEILCFIDADMTVPPGYLSAVARRFEDPECRYLGCAVEVVTAARSVAADIDRLLGFPIEAYLAQLHYAPTCCLSIRASLIPEVGPFDASLESGGDLEFGRRVHAAGIRQDFLEGVRLQHPARTRLGELARKRRRVARGHAQLVRRHPGLLGELGGSYLWRRLIRTPGPGRFRERARERAVHVSWIRALVLATVQLGLKVVSNLEYRRAGRTFPGIGPEPRKSIG